jgi:hypothetical protein
MSEFRDFLYLDTTRLHVFVAQLQGGVVSEITEKIKQSGGFSAGINVGVAPLAGNVGANKTKESERQQIIQLTDPSYFNVLYQYLEQSAKLQDITNSSLVAREKLDNGQFIEMRGQAEPPIVENWLLRVNTLFNFFERNAATLAKLPNPNSGNSKGRTPPTLPLQQIKSLRAALDLMTDFVNLSRKDPGKQYIRVSSAQQPYPIWCGLVPEFVILPLQSVLPSDVKVFGRVERILGEKEVWKIVDFIEAQQNASGTSATQLLNMLNSFNTMTKQQAISENDLQAKYPDIFVTPIAIYR